MLPLFVAAALSLSYADDASAGEAVDVGKLLPGLHLLEPIWSSPVVHGESVIPLQLKEGGAIEGRLAFTVAELLEVKTADGKRKLEPGRDVRLAEDGRTLIFPADAGFLFLKEADLYPPAGAPNSYKHRVGHPEQNMLFHQGHWFHDRQIEVTYRRKEEWSGPVPQWDEKALPRTLGRLRAGKPLSIGVSGDSITQGYNASGFASLETTASPFQPAYSELVAAQLAATYKSEITLRNRAISGWSITNGHTDLQMLLAERPQLVIVAYGMNDVGRRDPEWFKKQVASLIERIHATDAEIEIILVAPMLGNPEWIHTPREMFPKYRDALASLTGPGIALADLTAVWETMSRNKLHLDMTGNGLNHPNDFGHRLYAQVVLSLLVPPAK